MRVIQLTAKAGPDGKLHLTIPGGAADAEYEVAVVVQPKPPPRTFPEGYKPTPEELGWPPGFLEQMYGSIDDDKFIRHPQPPADPVEPLELG
jgi:uracil-DNA glycosylase